MLNLRNVTASRTVVIQCLSPHVLSAAKRPICQRRKSPSCRIVRTMHYGHVLSRSVPCMRRMKVCVNLQLSLIICWQFAFSRAQGQIQRQAQHVVDRFFIGANIFANISLDLSSFTYRSIPHRIQIHKLSSLNFSELTCAPGR